MNDLLERIVRLEAEMEGQREQAKSHRQETMVRFERIDAKLDDISHMLHKGRGMGAVLAVMGTAIVTSVIGALIYGATR